MKSSLLVFALIMIANMGISAPAPPDYTVTERGPHHRVWSRTTWIQTPTGRQVPRTNSFVELQTGMHYLRDGQWTESQELIQGCPGGAIAQAGQNRVFFANDLATPGSVYVQAVDGTVLRSHFLCLAYFDPATSKMAVISEVKSSQGRILEPNQVLYEDALASIKGSVRYTYTKAGLEQDVLIEEPESLPDPTGLGLSANCTIQAVTEWVEAPEPAVLARQQIQVDGGVLQSEELNFGSLRFGPGKALSIGIKTPANPVSTTRHWFKTDGRRFLIEQLPLKILTSQMTALWQKGAFISPRTKKQFASTGTALPRLKASANTTRPMRLAANISPPRGLVLDWILVSGTNNFTFQSDQTYYVSGPVTLTGTTTFEASTIKFAPTNNPCLSLGGSPVWKTTPYGPVVFTCREDGTVGALIPGGSGTPQRISATGLSTQWAVDVRNARFSHLSTALHCENNFQSWHCQFVDCGTAAGLGINADLYNVLFAYCDTPLSFATRPCGSYCPPVVTAQHVTADNCATFMSTSGTFLYNGSLTLQNSLLTSVTNLTSGWPIDITTNSSCIFASSDGVYTTAAGGHYYLPEGSTNRNAGVTSIDAGLAKDLKQRTTYPPASLVFRGVTNDITFSPQVQRDTDIPDRGWHYNALDYLIGFVWVTAPVSVNVSPGTAIGILGTNNGAYGLCFGNGARFYCNGSPAALNRIVEFSTVQEQTASGLCQPWYGLITDGCGGDPCHFDISFTDFSVSGQDIYHLGTYTDLAPAIRHCQFHSGRASVWGGLQLTNSLFDRVVTDIMLFDEAVPSLRNNTFFGGDFSFMPMVTNSVIKDNLFDKTTLYADLSYGGYDGGYNAFVTNCDRILPAFSSDLILSASPAYQTAGWGSFYLPTNSALINAGSVTNAGFVGLFHFTTTTNQVKDGSTRLDIGYHAPALDSSGNPVDTDGDGIPDTVEDPDGDGSASGHPTDWQSSENGTTGVNGLQVFTPWK